MQMMRHSRSFRDQGNDLRRHLERLDRTQSQSFQTRVVVEDRNNEVPQSCPWIQIPTIRAQMNTGKDDFLVASMDQRSNFLDDSYQRQAAASSPNCRNNAEGTVGITAILHFNDCPRPAGGAEVRFRF